MRIPSFICDRLINWCEDHIKDKPIVIISKDNNVYLTRYHIHKAWYGGVMYHIFSRPDADQELHDHPWPFMSIVLRGGYSEQRPRWRGGSKLNEYAKGSIIFRWPWSRHKVFALYAFHVNTLVIRGPKIRNWGFWQQGADGKFRKFIPWKKFKGV